MKLFSSVVTLAAINGAMASPAKRTAPKNVNDPNVPWINDGNFIQRIMDAHWYWRRIHCAQDLHWDPELAKQALESVQACTKRPQHVRYQVHSETKTKSIPGSWRQQSLLR
jgi:uncharacterized protein YkwD